MKRSTLKIYVAAILFAAQVLHAQPGQWSRIAMDKGGVAEDIQLITCEDPSAVPNIAWSACMNGGCFRSIYYNGNWMPWTEYMSGKNGFGIDAIRFAYPGDQCMEHALFATSRGVWYAQADGGNFPTVWGRVDGYPNNDWKLTLIHDAAFWCQTNGQFPYPPGYYFYVILKNVTEANNPGIYRWDHTATPPNFIRVDVEPGYPPHSYRHFYRDLNHREVLYVIKNTDESGGSITGCGFLYRITGDYDSGSENFTRLTPDVQGNPGPRNYNEVVGFNQWLDGNTVYSYILFHQVTSTTDRYYVYLSTNLDNTNSDDMGQLIYNCPTESGPPRDLTQIYDYQVGFRVVGKPTGGLNASHRLWMATDKYGMWYVETDPDDPGDPLTEEQINDGLKRWAPRMVIPDPDHIGTGEVMRILFGTHQKGVWYLKFSR